MQQSIKRSQQHGDRCRTCGSVTAALNLESCFILQHAMRLSVSFLATAAVPTLTVVLFLEAAAAGTRGALISKCCHSLPSQLPVTVSASMQCMHMVCAGWMKLQH
jgi:hypothetical protein